MTNEELILEKLERLETQIQPLIKTSEKIAELKKASGFKADYH